MTTNRTPRARKAIPNGAVLWQGDSLLDGRPIVVIATGLANASTNSKTGNMVQTYILRADVSPVEAVKSGADGSICGSGKNACPHRGNGDGTGRTCYVNVGQGPLAVWRAWKRGAYAEAIEYAGLLFTSRDNGAPCIGKGRVVRLGTYGDPAAVPVHIWQAITRHAVGYTGYTHQWRSAPQLGGLCMASVDSEAQALEARAAGWRTFRVALPAHAKRMATESICPASAEAGKKLTCAACLACDGTAKDRRGSIVIKAHGGFAVMANINKRSA